MTFEVTFRDGSTAIEIDGEWNVEGGALLCYRIISTAGERTSETEATLIPLDRIQIVQPKAAPPPP